MSDVKHPASSVSVQKLVVFFSVLLFAVKIAAWFFTNSVAVLTDALESTVNVVAGFVGLYSLRLSAKPKDMDHPYGHGKAEFISAALEGVLISIAGVIIIIKAVMQLFNPHEIEQLNLGLLLIGGSAIVNFFMGIYCVRTGKKNNSLALIASGKHLLSDMYSTLGIMIGLGLLLITGKIWIDSIMAIIFAVVIIFTGAKILRSSLAGIMDEADDSLLKDLVSTLNKNRRVNWIDLHNVRIQKFGPTLHIDCHLTVPWYLNVDEAHEEVDALSELVKNKYGESVELFVHSDGCRPFSCRICNKFECTVRQHPYEKTITWTLDNIKLNNKHDINS